MKELFFILIFFTSLIARENPFLPIIYDQTEKAATNVKEKRADLDHVKVKLPSSARVLKDVTFNYQKVNGSISKKKLHIDKNIDWHNYLVVSQLKEEDFLPKIKQKVEKKIEVSKKEKKVKPLNKSFYKITFPKYLELEFYDDHIKMITKDKNIRDFSISKPYKFVFDFKRSNAFYTKAFDIKKKPYKKAVFGSHKGYYRVVINLDGHYKYKVSKKAYGYLVAIR